MSKCQKTVSLFLIAAILLLLVFLPKNIDSILSRSGYLDWLRPKKEPFNGIITVWHVVGFKPYVGSVGAWLGTYASKLEKRHFGVYFTIESMSEAAAVKRLNAGEVPDLISFPPGFIESSALRTFTETELDSISNLPKEPSGYAVPFAASCRLLLYFPGKVNEAELLKNPSLAEKNSFDDFKTEKADCCIADARQAGDMQRLMQMNKVGAFEAVPFESKTELVQYIGISSAIDEAKLSYVMEFIKLITGEKAQESLPELGLLPLNDAIEPQFEDRILDQAYRKIRGGDGPAINPFG